MIRNVIVTLLFFFGPALLMFVLRNIFLFWKLRREINKHQPDIIDITPQKPNAPSHFFLASVIAIGLISAYFAYAQLTMDDQDQRTQYIPAHINAQGQLIPEEHITRPAP
ncbi:MAG: hypothetical protein COB41_02210 [Proteobacteria bacterium]|nr:hypothetical protein [Mariprofundus ferrooxydans]PCI45215.1 MAG: hypothetical protein COB41_02210 [Pseudomonadota bacterium]